MAIFCFIATVCVERQSMSGKEPESAYRAASFLRNQFGGSIGGSYHQRQNLFFSSTHSFSASDAQSGADQLVYTAEARVILPLCSRFVQPFGAQVTPTSRPSADAIEISIVPIGTYNVVACDPPGLGIRSTVHNPRINGFRTSLKSATD